MYSIKVFFSLIRFPLFSIYAVFSFQPVWTQWGNYSSKMFSIEAVDRIEEHNKRDPMFLYLAYQAVHSANQVEAPLQAPQKWINKFKYIKNQGRRKYAAMVAAMDDGVGKVHIFISNCFFVSTFLMMPHECMARY